MKHNTYLYSRVSTNTQDSSTEQQAQQLEQFCLRKGFTNVINVVDQDVSGGKPIFERPAGKMLLEAKKGDVVICVKHDRMFRSLRDAVNTIGDWFELGVSVYFLNLGELPIDMKTPHTKFMLYMLMATAELEKDTISERTVKNLKFRKENHKTYSSAPYGFDNVGERGNNGKIENGKLVRNEGEQNVINFIKDLNSKGNSLNDIAKYLNIHEIKSKKGGKWYAKTVQDVLENTLNKQSH